MNASTSHPSPFLNKTPANSQMSLMEHLDELRQRLIICISAALVGIIAAFCYALPAIEILKQMAWPVLQNPKSKALLKFVQLTPGEVMMSSLKLSVVLGLAAASPIILYQILRFVLPGLSKQEKVRLLWVVLGGTALFIAGVAFAYYIVTPMSLLYLLDYGQEVAQSQISIAQYVDFCLALILLTGVMFELPLFLFFLSLMGLIRSQQLIDQWRMATIIIAVSAAVITPSQDPFTMILVAAAMVGLYFISIVPIRLIGK